MPQSRKFRPAAVTQLVSLPAAQIRIAAVRARRSICTKTWTAVRTFLPFVHLLEKGANGPLLTFAGCDVAAVQFPRTGHPRLCSIFCT